MSSLHLRDTLQAEEAMGESQTSLRPRERQVWREHGVCAAGLARPKAGRQADVTLGSSQESALCPRAVRTMMQVSGKV